MSDADRDAWLREALRHAPDASALPPASISETILAQARAATAGERRGAGGAAAAAARPAWLAFWDWLARPPVAAGFASVMAATIVGLMWWDRPLDEAMPRSPSAAQMPVESTPNETTSGAPPAGKAQDDSTSARAAAPAIAELEGRRGGSVEKTRKAATGDGAAARDEALARAEPSAGTAKKSLERQRPASPKEEGAAAFGSADARRDVARPAAPPDVLGREGASGTGDDKQSPTQRPPAADAAPVPPPPTARKEAQPFAPSSPTERAPAFASSPPSRDRAPPGNPPPAGATSATPMAAAVPPSPAPPAPTPARTPAVTAPPPIATATPPSPTSPSPSLGGVPAATSPPTVAPQADATPPAVPLVQDRRDAVERAKSARADASQTLAANARRRDAEATLADRPALPGTASDARTALADRPASSSTGSDARATLADRPAPSSTASDARTALADRPAPPGSGSDSRNPASERRSAGVGSGGAGAADERRPGSPAAAAPAPFPASKDIVVAAPPAAPPNAADASASATAARRVAAAPDPRRPLASLLREVDAGRWSRRSAAGIAVTVEPGWRGFLREVDALAGDGWTLEAIDPSAPADADPPVLVLQPRDERGASAIVRLSPRGVVVDSVRRGMPTTRRAATLEPAELERLRSLRARLPR